MPDEDVRHDARDGAAVRVCVRFLSLFRATRHAFIGMDVLLAQDVRLGSPDRPRHVASSHPLLLLREPAGSLRGKRSARLARLHVVAIQDTPSGPNEAELTISRDVDTGGNLLGQVSGGRRHGVDLPGGLLQNMICHGLSVHLPSVYAWIALVHGDDVRPIVSRTGLTECKVSNHGEPERLNPNTQAPRLLQEAALAHLSRLHVPRRVEGAERPVRTCCEQRQRLPATLTKGRQDLSAVERDLDWMFRVPFSLSQQSEANAGALPLRHLENPLTNAVVSADGNQHGLSRSEEDKAHTVGMSIVDFCMEALIPEVP
mmetsp:Transcript_14100/g.52940  ORF Transcript_14100/g.52940 Transcript_14100/m.52940 type:complete len:315 (-) Transcript_14100:866-1810(-)